MPPSNPPRRERGEDFEADHMTGLASGAEINIFATAILG
jgi:hypothetical protein